MIKHYNEFTLEEALALLDKGHVVAMPTESVYGLAADATNDIAVSRIYQTKSRPTFNPLIIHVDSIEMARKWGIFTPLAEKLAYTFWNETPRSLTLVMKRNNEKLSHLVTAGLETVAIRIPIHAIAIDLINNFGKPLAAPSANRSNHISPTTATAVKADLDTLIPLIIDGGSCSIGLESTIIDVTGNTPILLRPGGTTVEEIENKIQKKILLFNDIKEPYKNTKDKLVAPGMMKRHYAPSIPLRLNVLNPKDGEAYLNFGETSTQNNTTLNLSKTGDLMEAAANLFKMMRLLDISKYSGIAVAPIPNTGIGHAINDRLNRAAYVENQI